jgi:hypothetical protein
MNALLKQVSFVQCHSIFLLILIIIVSRFLVLRLHCKHLILSLERLFESLMYFQFNECGICFVKLTHLCIWTKFEVRLGFLCKEFFYHGLF